MTAPNQALLPTYDKLSFSGVFGTAQAPAEIWAWGLTFEPKATQDSLATRVARCHDAYAQFIAPLMPPYVVLTRTRLAQVIDAGRVGHAEDGSYLQADDERDLAGGQALNVTWPLQTALCVSWSSARPGPTGKGRCFLPMPGFTLSSPSFTIGDNGALATVTAFRSMVNFLNGEDATGTPIAGASVTMNRHVVASTHGTRSAVTKYRVGHVPDTMRSRRNQLLESYVELPANSGAI